MIQRGIIWEYGKKPNRLLVRIPYFEKAGDKQVIFECLIAVPSGVMPSYKIGDIVFVDFENNDLNYPVVVSKLVTNNFDYNSNVSSLYSESLKVSGPVELTKEFKVGDITYSDLYYCKKAIQEITGNTELVDKLLIWENPDITQSFVTLEIDLKKYSMTAFKYIVVEYINGKTDYINGVNVSKMVFDNKEYKLSNTNIVTNQHIYYERRFSINTDTKKLNFEKCNYFSSANNYEITIDQQGQYLIPVRLYLTNNI